MDEYYDDDFGVNGKKKKKQLNPNPNGPYQIKDFIFLGKTWDIIIENVSNDELKVLAMTDDDVTEHDVDCLKNYIEKEGFEQAAIQHNLFW
jgi:hypothetical protein